VVGVQPQHVRVGEGRRTRPIDHDGRLFVLGRLEDVAQAQEAGGHHAADGGGTEPVDGARLGVRVTLVVDFDAVLIRLEHNTPLVDSGSASPSVGCACISAVTVPLLEPGTVAFGGLGTFAHMANRRSLAEQYRTRPGRSIEARDQHVTWQPMLLDAAPGGADIDQQFTSARRIKLDATAWVEHVTDWVSAPGALFELLVEVAPWNRRTVPMYGRMVEEPRLTAWYGSGPHDPSAPPILGQMADALSARFGREFDSVGAALYRDGRDSVAWHGDRIDPEIVEPVVAIVSLGSRRALRMRPKGTSARGAARAFTLLPGDLFVMGGMSQRTWEHSVPKVASAGPRLSLQFRHSR
jgi:alkylated DNA repair dioxygenase AlkB